MNDQLNGLISAYEDEIKQLEKQLNYCLLNGDVDYVGAYHCNNALMHTKGELYVLKRLDDPLFDKKTRQLHSIDFYKKRLADESSDFMKEYYKQHILKAEQELERLNQIPKQDNSSSESIIAVAISRLMKNKIKNLKLILRKCDNLFLDFSYKAKALKVSIPYLKDHKKRRIVSDHEIRFLHKPGFELNKHETQLTMRLAGEKGELLSKVNSLLFEIVFSVFPYGRAFENESYIQFTEKNGH